MKPGTRSLLGLAALAAGVWLAQAAWQHFSEAALGRELARAAQPGDIRMVSSRSCVYCDAARQWLTRHGVAHSECFIEGDADCAALYKAANAPGTPLLLVRGQPQLGFSAQRVLKPLMSKRPAARSFLMPPRGVWREATGLGALSRS